MLATRPTKTLKTNSTTANEPKVRLASWGKGPAIFTDTYSEETNIVVWQRELANTL